jgi:hypothetical protein
VHSTVRATTNEKPILAHTLRLPWSAFPADCSNYLKGMVEREGIEPSTPALSGVYRFGIRRLRALCTDSDTTMESARRAKNEPPKVQSTLPPLKNRTANWDSGRLVLTNMHTIKKTIHSSESSAPTQLTF